METCLAPFNHYAGSIWQMPACAGGMGEAGPMDGLCLKTRRIVFTGSRTPWLSRLCPLGYPGLVGHLSSQQLQLPLEAGACIATVPE